MILINIGAGAVRPGPPFINVDSLCQLLPPGTPEREALNLEMNYAEADLRNPLPFTSDYADGLMLSHVLEHFCAINGTNLLRECHRVLKPGGVVMVSVPDVSYHRQVYREDNKANALRLFGETIPASELKQTFLEYACFFTGHCHVYTEDSLWAMLVNGGFADVTVKRLDAKSYDGDNEPIRLMHQHLNRRMFSLVMTATK